MEKLKILKLNNTKAPLMTVRTGATETSLTTIRFNMPQMLAISWRT
jgi:hypothetical protein